MDVPKCDAFLEIFSQAVQQDLPFRIKKGPEVVLGERGFEQESCAILFDYLEQNKKILFSNRIFLDHCYLYRKRVDKDNLFEDAMISLRLGGEIPANWICNQPIFKKIVKSNYLHHKLIALKRPLIFDEKKGAAFLFSFQGKSEWIFWNDIQVKEHQFYFEEELLFETDKNYKFLPGYTCLHTGICRYHSAIDPKWEPFQVDDPKEWGYKHLAEVWIVSLPIEKPPMWRRTHAYLVLKDDQGNIRSVGQDVLVDRSNYEIREIFNRKPGFGKITTPDAYVFFPRNSRRFWHTAFEITKEEHDRMVAIVETDKGNKDHSMSVLKGNCVSYVLKLLREGMGLKLEVSMHSLHILLKEWVPNSWYKWFLIKVHPWYVRQPVYIQRACFFLPFIYIPHLVVGLFALYARQNNYKKQRDFSLLDVLFYPWKLSCEHPLALHRKLERIKRASKN